MREVRDSTPLVVLGGRIGGVPGNFENIDAK
jgi:hypothetical protein